MAAKLFEEYFSIQLVEGLRVLPNLPEDRKCTVALCDVVKLELPAALGLVDSGDLVAEKIAPLAEIQARQFCLSWRMLLSLMLAL